jgi:hypothetical protein
MICKTSCFIFAAFFIGTIVMKLTIYNRPIYKKLLATLDAEQIEKYENIIKMRSMKSLQGYVLGIILSLVVLLYNYYVPSRTSRLTTTTMVCIAGAITMLTHYFYYMLSPKSDWMLNHLKTPEQNKEWLNVYRTMSWKYHSSLLVGVISAFILGNVFKCS